jgi:uncharacterized protein YecT (DUF1311 family)
MKTILLILSVILVSTQFYAQTNNESRNYFENSDKRLNEVYQQLIDAKSSDPVFVKNLRSSERAWIEYRDAQLTLLYPGHAPIAKLDSLSNNELIYLSSLTKARTKVLLGMLEPLTMKKVYVSDLEILRSGNINGGLGLDKPYWTSQIIICAKTYKKGVVIHPEAGDQTAYAEFQIPRPGGRLLGVVGWAAGMPDVNYNGKMRYRILVDGNLIYGNEIVGKECRGIDLDLGAGKVLRIESDDGGDGNYSDHLAFGNLRIEY